jgi:hypothetical protein
MAVLTDRNNVLGQLITKILVGFVVDLYRPISRADLADKVRSLKGFLVFRSTLNRGSRDQTLARSAVDVVPTSTDERGRISSAYRACQIQLFIIKL